MSLSPEDGIVNQVTMALGILKDPIPFMGMKEYFYWVVALSSVWKTVRIQRNHLFGSYDGNRS